jgi:hypothetical protein
VAGPAAIEACFPFSLSRMNSATPLPIIENAGINIQYHQPEPIDLESATAIIKNATPVKMFLIE